MKIYDTIVHVCGWNLKPIKVTGRGSTLFYREVQDIHKKFFQNDFYIKNAETSASAFELSDF